MAINKPNSTFTKRPAESNPFRIDRIPA